MHTHTQMTDNPLQVTSKQWAGDDLVELDRNMKFELMLVAIEENSGCMSVLSSVGWSYKLISERDPLKDVHFQTKLDELSIESFNSESEYIRFYHKYLLNIFRPLNVFRYQYIAI